MTLSQPSRNKQVEVKHPKVNMLPLGFDDLASPNGCISWPQYYPQGMTS